MGSCIKMADSSCCTPTNNIYRNPKLNCVSDACCPDDCCPPKNGCCEPNECCPPKNGCCEPNECCPDNECCVSDCCQQVFGSSLPQFKTTAVYPGADNKSTEIKCFGNGSFKNDDFSIHFWIPKAFTYICPLEIKELNELYDELKAENIGVYIYSGDTPEVIQAWIASEDRGLTHLGHIKMPFVSDSLCILAKAMKGYLDGDDNNRCSVRMTHVTKGNKVLYSQYLHPLVGRNIQDIVRTTRAIRESVTKGALCKPTWTAPGSGTIDL